MASINLFGQDGAFKKFRELHPAEKWWVIMHLRFAKKAYKITNDVQTRTQELKVNAFLDADDNGGQLDAFRHAFWMACLVQVMRENAARKLGQAHEKDARRTYERLKEEDGIIPDFMSTVMDLKNNEEGIRLGKMNPEMECDQLENIILDVLQEGQLWIMKKDVNGNYYSYDNELIKYEDWHGKWYNEKTLVPSNYRVKRKP